MQAWLPTSSEIQVCHLLQGQSGLAYQSEPSKTFAYLHQGKQQCAVRLQ